MLTFLQKVKFYLRKYFSENRIPSWTDRVLYASSSQSSQVTFYNSFPSITISDHKPVTSIIEIDENKINGKLNINTGLYYDTNTINKNHCGFIADRSVGYTWLILFTIGYGNTVRGIFLAFMILLSSYYIYN